MKFKFIILSFLTLSFFYSKSQCLQIESILVDACNPTSLEPNNEMVRFKNGTTPLNISQISISSAPASGLFQNNVWTTVSLTWNGLIQNAATATATSNLQATILNGCGKLLEPPAGIIPANADVLMITSTNPSSADNTFAGLVDTLYVVYQNRVATNTTGHFGNGSSSGTRGFCLIDNSTGCRDTVQYDCALLLGGNGATVEYSVNGTATYVNNGCQAPFLPFAVNAGNNQSGCANSVFNLLATPTGQYSSIAWSGGTGTFGSASSLATTYTPGIGETGTVNLTVTLNSACVGSTVTDNISLTLTPAPTPTITSNAPSGAICNGSSITLTASGGSTYLWNTTATTNTITVSPSASTVYTVTATTTCGSSDETFSVTVNNLPNVTVNSPTICEGASATLTANNATTYSWSAGGSGSSISVSPAVGTTTYTVTGTVNTCTNTAVATVSVTANPVVTVNSPAICEGASATLTANNATTYSWSTGGSGGSISVSPAIGITTYTVTGTANSCTNTAVATVSVTAIPNVTVNSPTICEGASLTLTANNATTYSWSTGGSGSSISVSPAIGTTTYTVTGTVNTCTNTAVATVSVTSNPIITVNSPTICAGESAVLNGGGATAFTWSSGGSGASITVNPTTTTSYTVTGTENGCTNTAIANVVVNQLPTIISTQPPVIITSANCGSTNGSITGASAAGANPISYQWISSLGAVIGAAADISSLGSGVYYLAATDGNGCRDSVSFTITTLNGPATPTFVTVSPVCEGGSFTLTVTNPIIGATYNWVSSGNPTQSGVDLTSITVNSASVTNVGPYTVEVVDAGCSSFGAISVAINATPIPAITGSTSFCFGTSTVLDASSSLPSTGTTYQWYFNNAPISGETSATLTATQAGDYQVLVTNTGCDSLSAETAITINTLPVVNTSVSPVVITNAGCGLTNASVIGANATGSQPFNYVWTNSSGTVLSLDTLLTNVGAGTYYLIALDNNGCADSSSVVLTAAPSPATPLFDAAPNACEGSTFSLSVSNTLLGATYTWTATGLPSQTGVDLTSITVVDANSSNVGTYTVSVTVDNCVETGTVSATFNARPVPEITSNATSFCAGDSLLLNANSQTGVTYAWYYNTSILSGAVNNSFFATQSGNYQLYVNDGTCDSLSVNYPVILNSLPTVTVNNGSACINAPSVQLTATGAQTYTWTTGTTPSTGDIVTVPTSIAGTTGYIVTGTDLNGCVDTTVVTVTINSNPVITINGLQNSNITLCNGIDTLLTAAGANTYVWSTTQTINPITYSSTAASTVTVLGVDINGCVDSTTITTTLAPGPSIGSVYGVPTICNGYRSELSLDSTAGYTYSWVNNLGTVLSSDTMVTITTAGNYSLTVSNSCGSTTTPITIGSASINVSFVADSTIGLAPLQVQFTNTSSGADSYYWLFGNGDTLVTNLFNPTADLYQQFTEPGTYSAYLLGTNNSNYCSGSMNLEIIVLAQNIGIVIPNVFSPNGDLINDYFGVQSYGIKAFSCTIFNRWGTLITELDNVNEKWTPGSNISEGTYFYLIKATGIDNKDYSREGYMLLVR